MFKNRKLVRLEVPASLSESGPSMANLDLFNRGGKTSHWDLRLIVRNNDRPMAKAGGGAGEAWSLIYSRARYSRWVPACVAVKLSIHLYVHVHVRASTVLALCSLIKSVEFSFCVSTTALTLTLVMH